MTEIALILQICRPYGTDRASDLPVLQICRPCGADRYYKYAASTGPDGASGLPVPQICRPYGAWIGASPKSVIIRFSVAQPPAAGEYNTADLIADIKTGQKKINDSMESLFTQLKNIGIEA